MTFEIGDVVRLKSGGPWMTVAEAAEDKVGCIFFEFGSMNRVTVSTATLITNYGGPTQTEPPKTDYFTQRYDYLPFHPNKDGEK